MQFKVPKEKKKDFVDSRTEEFNRKMKKKAAHGRIGSATKEGYK